MKKTLLSLVAILAFAGFANAQVPARVGWWKFEDPNDLLKATIGQPLELSANTGTGTQSSVNGPATGNLGTLVPKGSYLIMNHGIAPNIAIGDSVNEYTVQIDFSVASVPGTWYSFIQTNPATTVSDGLGGDADLFVRKSDGAIGTATTAYSINKIIANTWYRMLISVKNGEFFNVYLNGEKWLSAPVGANKIDGRWALVDKLLIFADNDGDDGDITCSELGMWNVALDDTQATSLGDATTVIVPSQVGLWKFDDANDLLKATIGQPLELSANTGTGTQTSVGGPAVGDLATEVPKGSYLIMNHGIAPNIAIGDSVNEYTVQIDFSVASVPGTWYSFIQTNPATTVSDGLGGDADLFVRKSDGAIGTSQTAYSANKIAANTWYRLLISVKNGEFFNVYLNGEKWLSAPVGANKIDGRWALVDKLLIFADNDGDDGIISCSELGIWDVALTDTEVFELGGFTSNVSIRDNKANAVKLYPNPAENNLYISGKSTLSKVEVYTVLGAQVKEYSNVLQSINVSDLKTGIYIIRLTDTNGKTVTSKFIKK